MSDLGPVGGGAGAGAPPVVSYVSPGHSAPVMVTSAAMDALRRTKPWVRFISVMMYIGVGFAVLAGIAIALLGGLLNGSRGGATAAPPPLFGVVYFCMAFFYLPPAIYLGRYARRIGRALETGDPLQLEGALVAQKSFWRYVGILMLIGLIFYAVAILGFIGITLATHVRR